MKNHENREYCERLIVDVVGADERSVLDFVNRLEDSDLSGNYINKMYGIEKYLAMGGKVDAITRVVMRKHLCEIRQYLQKQESVARKSLAKKVAKQILSKRKLLNAKKVAKHKRF